ncbi:hypothetical protein HG530_007889 [Fusarium avenaceum]|nr:hypothetical protein HG530_007889 [Fusarium avenaceum]
MLRLATQPKVVVKSVKQHTILLVDYNIHNEEYKLAKKLLWCMSHRYSTTAHSWAACQWRVWRRLHFERCLKDLLEARGEPLQISLYQCNFAAQSLVYDGLSGERLQQALFNVWLLRIALLPCIPFPAVDIGKSHIEDIGNLPQNNRFFKKVSKNGLFLIAQQVLSE